MNEKSPQVDYYRRKPEQVYKRFYQSAARELTYNALVKANPDQSIHQPTEDEGRQTIELVPINKSWDNLCIIVHPEAEWVPVSGELQVSIQLGQGFIDRSSELEATALEFVKEFNVFLSNGEYTVTKRNILFDYANPRADEMAMIFDNETLASQQEIYELNKIINRSSVRPPDF
jgi:hypothetical protein